MEPNKNMTPDSDTLQITTEIVSLTAYLSGVKKENFSDIPGHLQIEIYNKTDKNSYAKIIRNLCILRNTLMKKYYEINERLTRNYQSFYSMTDIIPQDAVMYLSGERINPFKGNRPTLYGTVVELNRLISDRINNALNVYPVWVNRQYMRDLFIMPNGLTDDGIKAAAATYYANLGCYPYKLYINWTPTESGNILLNDKKFATLLYEWHHSTFTEYSKVSDVGTHIKGTIYDYIEESNKVAIFKIKK